MVDNKYSFGLDLRNTIILGKDRKTELRELFENNFFHRSGIRIIHSYFNGNIMNPYIFIHADSCEDLNPSDWDITHNIYYPRKCMRSVIFDCFNDALTKVELPKIEFPVKESIDVVSLTSYARTAANIYFNVNIKEIDKEAHKAFPNVKFNIRFNLSYTSQHYYLIFDNSADKKTAFEEGTSLRITDYVFSVCRQNDPLNIFSDNVITPIVTSKEEIAKIGKTMEIMRNNLDFDTL